METTVIRYLVLALSMTIAAPLYAQQPPLLQDTRTSVFRYDSAGLLNKEIIEPGDSAFCLVKTYHYDTFGNRDIATIRNCGVAGDPTGVTNDGEIAAAPCPTCDAAFQARTSFASFAPTTANPVPGQFSTSSTNALNHQESREFDFRFGTITKLTGPNGLVTRWTYDDFGRKKTELRSDGSTSTWFYERCGDAFPAGTGICPPSGLAVYRVRVQTDGAPSGSTYYDGLNRVIRTESQDFDGNLVKTDMEFDNAGRVARTSKPFLIEGLQVWTTLAHDPLGRVKQVDEPTVLVAGVLQTLRTETEYHGQVTKVTVSNMGSTGAMPGGGAVQIKTVTKNSQGQVISVVQQ